MSDRLQDPQQVARTECNQARPVVKFAMWELNYLQCTARYLESEVRRIEDDVVRLAGFVKIDYRAEDFEWQHHYARRLNDHILAAMKRFAQISTQVRGGCKGAGSRPGWSVPRVHSSSGVLVLGVWPP